MGLCKISEAALCAVLLCGAGAASAEVVDETSWWSGLADEVKSWFGAGDLAQAEDAMTQGRAYYDSLDQGSKDAIRAKVEGLDPARREAWKQRAQGYAADTEGADKTEVKGFLEEIYAWFKGTE